MCQKSENIKVNESLFYRRYIFETNREEKVFSILQKWNIQDK